MADERERSARVAALNDALREAQCLPQGRCVFTSGVEALGLDFMMATASAVRAFNAFTGDNDPHCERDFGSFELGGLRLFWKIDCYEKGSDYQAGAETPENPATTDRVLTIMLADEY